MVNGEWDGVINKRKRNQPLDPYSIDIFGCLFVASIKVHLKDEQKVMGARIVLTIIQFFLSTHTMYILKLETDRETMNSMAINLHIKNNDMQRFSYFSCGFVNGSKHEKSVQ